MSAPEPDRMWEHCQWAPSDRRDIRDIAIRGPGSVYASSADVGGHYGAETGSRNLPGRTRRATPFVLPRTIGLQQIRGDPR